MPFVKVSFQNTPSVNEALIAWLAEADFDMFEENDHGVDAYIEKKNFSEEKLQDVLTHLEEKNNIQFSISEMEDVNWNKEWESNFKPVLVSDMIYIRAPFHQENKNYCFEIVIEPKMSFGTGHHATTSLMAGLMLNLDFNGRKVLDMGTGTGILAILACKMNAVEIDAIDNDPNAFENCQENIQKNNCPGINVQLGHAGNIEDKYDIILANINRNILLSDMSKYSSHLTNEGELLISGFLVSDKDLLVQKANECNLLFAEEAINENWLAIRFKKF